MFLLLHKIQTPGINTPSDLTAWTLTLMLQHLVKIFYLSFPNGLKSEGAKVSTYVLISFLQLIFHKMFSFQFCYSTF